MSSKPEPEKNWFVYILLCEDGSLYTGCSNDVTKRFRLHQQGLGAKYTRSHPVSKILYQEKCHNYSAALKRELAIKKMSHVDKLAIAGGEPG